MAKKRSTRKTARKTTRRKSRRGRVGALGMAGIPLEEAGMALAGAFTSRLVGTGLKKIEVVQKYQYIRPLAKGVLAIAALAQKNPKVQAFGLGMIGEAALDVGQIFMPESFGAKGMFAAPNAVSGRLGAVTIDLDELSNGVYGAFDEMQTDRGVYGFSDEDEAVAGAY